VTSVSLWFIEFQRTRSECPTSTPSLCRRVRPVLLLASLLFVFAAPAKPRGVTLDVKDADIHVVLKSIQKQCGIKNLVIDPGVTGSGTFLFHNVQCKVALDTVLRMNGLAAKSYSSSVVAVAPR
jgi:type II secretory pathway component GspD/PulD (secretin)